MAKLCNCGSGLERDELYDARGIFCAFVCDACETEKRGRFRAEIFEDAGYYTDEAVDAD